VNLAARLQGQSRGGDIVQSRTVADDPAVEALLDEQDVSEEAAELRGFDAPVPFVRAVATANAAAPPR
jgi:class 3 adenylate cyclase